MQQNENKQQRALSQSGRQHMVKLVVLARFELILLKPAKGFHAFILYFQQERKGVSAYLAFLNTCSQSSCFYPHYSHFEFPGCAGVFLQLDLDMQNICWDKYWHICNLHSDMRGNIQIELSWDVKMKEKELVSFVSFAVQFRKVCARLHTFTLNSLTFLHFEDWPFSSFLYFFLFKIPLPTPLTLG